MPKRELELNATLEPLPIPVYIFSYSDRRFIAANGLFRALVGYSLDELRTMPWQNILPPDDLHLAVQAIELAASGEFPTEPIQWRFLNKQGAIVTGSAMVRAMVVVSDDGRSLGCHCVAIVSPDPLHPAKRAEDVFDKH